MQKMKLEYAEKLLNGGYAFGNKYFSKQKNMLIVETTDDWYPYNVYYCGAELDDNDELRVDSEGYVSFSRVEPLVDENTKFYFS